MLTKNQLKLWLRSGSLRFARQSGPVGEVDAIAWHGKPVHYRNGTSDYHVINSILLKEGAKAEYYIPADIRPKTIFDIGGNIGAAAVYFAATYPGAKVVSFEPVAGNFDILQRNIAAWPNAEAHNVALGTQDETIELIESPDVKNQGGFSAYQRGAKADAARIQVVCRNANAMIAEHGWAPDLIKIDTEGFEYPILTAIAPETLSRVSWIVGELHGENDFELLAYLSQWFEIGIRKSVARPLCNFHARNRALVPM